MRKVPTYGDPADVGPGRTAVGAEAQGEHRLQGAGRHPGLVGAGLGGDLAAHHVPDVAVGAVHGGVAGEGVGLGEQPGIEDLGARPARRRRSVVRVAPPGTWPPATYGGAADEEGRRPVEGLGEVADHGGLVGGRVDHLDVVGGRHRGAGGLDLAAEGVEHAAVGHHGRVADRHGQGGDGGEPGAVGGGEDARQVGGAVVAADDVRGGPHGGRGQVGAGLGQLPAHRPVAVEAVPTVGVGMDWMVAKVFGEPPPRSKVVCPTRRRRRRRGPGRGGCRRRRPTR